MTAKKIQIICTSPGMRRNGVQHPASAFYNEGRWTDEELAAFKADPNFMVRVADEGENTTTDADFEARVAAEVETRIQAKADELQKTFDQAVSERAADKVAELQAKIDNLEAKLSAANQADSQSTVKK